MLSAYCLSYMHWTVVPGQLAESYRDLAGTGFEAVCVSFSESEMQYSRRAVELQVKLAHEAGLKAFVIPSRLGGRFAGSPWMPSWWLARHPECVVPGTESWPVACLESVEFVDWIHGFMETILTDYPLDGIVWDEPKSVAAASRHPATLEKYGREQTPAEAMSGYARFLAALAAHCESVRPGLTQTLFCQKTDPEEFTREAAKIGPLEFFGYDGNLSRQSFFHEEPEWRKYRIESVWERTVAECSAAGKGTFALVENMLMPAEATNEFERNFAAYLDEYHPDHLSVYYYAHNNGDPEAGQEVVRRHIGKYLG